MSRPNLDRMQMHMLGACSANNLALALCAYTPNRPKSLKILRDESPCDGFAMVRHHAPLHITILRLKGLGQNSKERRSMGALHNVNFNTFDRKTTNHTAKKTASTKNFPRTDSVKW